LTVLSAYWFICICHRMWLQKVWCVIWFSIRGANNGWYEIHNLWPWRSSARWFLFVMLIAVLMFCCIS